MERIYACLNEDCQNYKQPITIAGEMQLADINTTGGFYVLFPNVICQCGSQAKDLEWAPRTA